MENQSMITMMTVLFCDEGRLAMKSVVRCDHGLCGVGSRRSLPTGSVHRTLAFAKTEQVEMNRSWRICSHLYLPCSSWCVL